MVAPTDSIDAILKVMAKHGATKVVYDSPTGDHLEIERAFIEPLQSQVVPAGGKPVPTGADPEEPRDLQCPCGHSLEVEHNAAGCLLGCSVEQCLEKPVKP